MIYIALVILISSSIFITFKLFKKYNIDNFQAITINYAVASVFGLLICGANIQISTITTNSWFPFALLIGFIFILTFVLFALSSQKAGVAITAVFSKVSVIIPVIAGILLYSESLNIYKILGVIATLVAFILIFYKKEKSKLNLALIFLPLLIFLGNGIIDTLLKYIEYHHINGDYNEFLTFIFLTAFVCGVFISIGRYILNRKRIALRNLIGGIVLGLLNYSTTYFMLIAMSLYQSNVVFPVQNVGIVATSALAGFIFFKEKLSLINWLGIFLAIMAILMIAFA